MDIVAILKPIYDVWQKWRADKRSTAHERRQARPLLVFVTSSMETDRAAFTLRNVGRPITKLQLDAPFAKINPSEYLGTEEKCIITFGSRPTLPVTVKVEYVDSLGHPDAMSIVLQRRPECIVLGYGSDT